MDADTPPPTSPYSVDLTARFVRDARASGRSVVFTNGCFDIIHVGHVRYLAAAKREGDVLVVGVNSDRSVRALKGPSRPINGEAERAEVLGALAAVDAVCVFDQDTPAELVSLLLPDVLVKGGDWPVEKIVGADVVTANGGRVLSLPFVEGRSTTGVIEAARRSAGG